MRCPANMVSVAMINAEITQLARTSLLLIDYAVRQGVDRGWLMRIAGLSEDILEDPDSRISTALQRFARYVRIISEAVQFRVEDCSQGVVVTWQMHPALAELRHPVEAGAALIVALGRDVTGADVNPLSVDLPGERPVNPSEYGVFFGSPVRFGRSVAKLTLSRQQVSLPTRAPDATLVGYWTSSAGISPANCWPIASCRCPKLPSCSAIPRQARSSARTGAGGVRLRAAAWRELTAFWRPGSLRTQLK